MIKNIIKKAALLLPHNRNDWAGILFYALITLWDIKLAVLLLAIKETDDRRYTASGSFEWNDIVRYGLVIAIVELIKHLAA